VAQKISIRQEGNEAIDDLLKEISKVDKRKEAVLKLIDIYNFSSCNSFLRARTRKPSTSNSFSKDSFNSLIA
jgi:ribosome biogenesis GTPase A